MISFYDIDINYINFLKQYDSKIPNISYQGQNKFLCGAVLNINNIDYYAPISSHTQPQRTSMPITDKNNKVISSIKFSFMIPVTNNVLTYKDFSIIRINNPKYAALLYDELRFCRNNEDKIKRKAQSVYDIGCNPNHVLYRNCCNFQMLEGVYNTYQSANLQPSLV